MLDRKGKSRLWRNRQNEVASVQFDAFSTRQERETAQPQAVRPFSIFDSRETHRMAGLLRLPGISVICVATALCPLSASAQAQSPPAKSQASISKPQPPTISIPRVTQPPKLEDYLNGAAHPVALQITGFRQRDPGDGTPVSEPTTAYLSYDDDNLYVVFVCKDEPGAARGHLTKREAVGSDDIVGILLDTFHDRQRAYEFFVNPLGTQMDAIATEGQSDDFSFDTLWHSEGRMTDDGYVAWMAIPFKSLRFSNAPKQTWGIALLRAVSRKNELSFWPYITHQIQGFAQEMATLEGLENLAIAPTVPPTLLQTASPTTVTGRQFFVKVSYLFRF